MPNLKLACAVVVVSALIAQATPALALPPPPPPVVVASKTPLAVQGLAVGVIGTAATLGLYDIFRRLTCNDFAGLGGPGFSQPMRPTDNALRPQNCRAGRP